MMPIPNLDVGIKNKVSIVIPTYKQFAYAKRAIESIIDYTTYPDYEIIASDDASGIPKLINYLQEMEARKKIKLLLHSERGQAKNATTAINTAVGQFICVFNDDVAIPHDNGNWLTVLVDYLNRNKGQWASVTPAMYHSPEQKTVYWVGKKKENWQNPWHDFLHAPFGDPSLPKTPVWCCYNTGACCLTWKGLTDFLPFGKNHQMYGADSDWCFEIERELGLTHWMIPDVYVYHGNIFNQRG